MNYHVQITVEGPGSSGSLVMNLPPEQFDFLRTMADAWNTANPLHAQPFIRVQREVGPLRADRPDDVCTYCGKTGHRASKCPWRDGALFAPGPAAL